MANKAKFLTKFYVRYRSTISLNKNLLLSGIVGFIVSLVVAYVSTKYSPNDFTNSAVTVISGFIFSKITFVFLFHFDNRKRYTKRFTGKLNIPVLKEIVKKMIFADSIFDIVNNVSRFLILLELLRMDYQPVQAATIASLIASLFSYLAINLIVRKLHVFGSKRKIW
jgi:Na+-driven multidrug efflux pump